jgi:hypothetical protein
MTRSGKKKLETVKESGRAIQGSGGLFATEQADRGDLLLVTLQQLTKTLAEMQKPKFPTVEMEPGMRTESSRANQTSLDKDRIGGKNMDGKKADNKNKKRIKKDQSGRSQPLTGTASATIVRDSERTCLVDNTENHPVPLALPLRQNNWEKVRSKRRGSNSSRAGNTVSSRQRLQTASKNRESYTPRQEVPRNRRSIEKIRRRLPKSAAIAITKDGIGDMSYAAAVKKARESISLDDLGILTTKVRRAVTDGLILEITGENATSKADSLALRMRCVLRNSGIRVTRPERRIDLRISDFDESITMEKLVSTVASGAGCQAESIRCGAMRRTEMASSLSGCKVPRKE